MHTVRQLLQTKGNEVWSVAPQTTVYQVLELMADKNVGALVVVAGRKVVGIFTERDYARKVILKGKDSKTVAVGELMTKNVLYVGPDETIDKCMALMTDKHTRHLPVLEKGQLVGLISIGDVVKSVISDQQFTIQELERYIVGGWPQT